MFNRRQRAFVVGAALGAGMAARADRRAWRRAQRRACAGELDSNLCTSGKPLLECVVSSGDFKLYFVHRQLILEFFSLA